MTYSYKTILGVIGLAAAMTVGAASATAGPCPCNADVDDNGAIDLNDALAVLECVGGDCSDCVNSCDLDCDGEVDLCDVEIVLCQFAGGPECCDTVACGACCFTDGTCTHAPATSETGFSCAETGGNYVGDDTVCDPDPCNAGGPVPTVSEWGMIAMALAALVGGTVVFGRPRRRVAGE